MVEVGGGSRPGRPWTLVNGKHNRRFYRGLGSLPTAEEHSIYCWLQILIFQRSTFLVSLVLPILLTLGRTLKPWSINCPPVLHQGGNEVSRSLCSFAPLMDLASGLELDCRSNHTLHKLLCLFPRWAARSD